MNPKILGYILLSIGISIIIYSGVSVYLVFTGSFEPFELFRFAGISLDPAKFLGGDISSPNQAILQGQEIGIQKTELIPSEMLNQPTNIIAHVVLMGFMAMVGFRLASIGAMLVRPIVVKLKTQEEKNSQ